MTEPGSAAADAQYTVQAVQDNAERLGLVWKRKRATITSADEPVMAVLDADTEPIAVTSMIGPVEVGQRVYVDVVPPSGNFVVGGVDLIAVGTTVGWVASRSNAGPITAEVPILMTTNTPFVAGRAYKISFQNDVSSGASFDTGVHRVYSGSILGTLLHATGFQLNQTPGFTEGFYSEVTVIAATTAARTITLSLFVVAGPATAVGSAAQLRWLKVEYVGPGSKFPNAIAI